MPGEVVWSSLLNYDWKKKEEISLVIRVTWISCFDCFPQTGFFLSFPSWIYLLRIMLEFSSWNSIWLPHKLSMTKFIGWSPWSTRANNLLWEKKHRRECHIKNIYIYIYIFFFFSSSHLSWATSYLQMSKGGKFLKKLWCCVGGRM